MGLGAPEQVTDVKSLEESENAGEGKARWESWRALHTPESNRSA
jgi:hypothetical protein